MRNASAFATSLPSAKRAMRCLCWHVQHQHTYCTYVQIFSRVHRMLAHPAMCIRIHVRSSVLYLSERNWLHGMDMDVRACLHITLSCPSEMASVCRTKWSITSAIHFYHTSIYPHIYMYTPVYNMDTMQSVVKTKHQPSAQWRWLWWAGTRVNLDVLSASLNPQTQCLICLICHIVCKRVYGARYADEHPSLCMGQFIRAHEHGNACDDIATTHKSQRYVHHFMFRPKVSVRRYDYCSYLLPEHHHHHHITMAWHLKPHLFAYVVTKHFDKIFNKESVCVRE